MKRVLCWTLALGALAAPGCGNSGPTAIYGEEEIIVLEVAPDSVPCTGEISGMCLQVRSSGEEEWRKFYEPVEGFEHEPGFLYTIEVARRELLDPPADASSYEYRLIRILDREAVGSSATRRIVARPSGTSVWFGPA